MHTPMLRGDWSQASPTDYAGAREAEKEELKHLIIYSLFKERQPKCVFLLEWHEKKQDYIPLGDHNKGTN
jgi:hypothetical protein